MIAFIIRFWEVAGPLDLSYQGMKVLVLEWYRGNYLPSLLDDANLLLNYFVEIRHNDCFSDYRQR